MSARRVLVHVGAPKTGTSAIQDMLFGHRARLAAEEGLLYPADRFDAHFLAALDLMELTWGGLETQAVGAWDRLAAEVRAWPGTSVVSHEILATASRAQVARALASFGEDAEVHVVMSVRDLARQLPAEWQENVKHRRVLPYRDFLEQVADPSRTGAVASWFWGVQEVPDVLDRWAGTLPPERVHLVTVPRPGGRRELLWERFAEVLGLDASTYSPSIERTNPSLGVAETALVRRLNSSVNRGVLAGEDYRHLVRELLVHRTLSTRTGSSRLLLPPSAHDWAVEVSQRWIDLLSERGYHVVGDLADLRPDPPSRDAAGRDEYVDPDHPDEAQVAEAAVVGLVTLLQEAARLGASERRLAAELHAAYEELERSRGLWFRLKRRLVREADRNRAAAWGLRAYRAARGRSSRSA